MNISKETLNDLGEKYSKVIKLMDDAKNDPVSQPYKSKYSAQKILIEMDDILKNLINNDTVEHQTLTAMLGFVYLYMGMISIDTEEISTGESYLLKCQVTIENHETKAEFVTTALNMYNQFGILFAESAPEKSQSYLEKAEALYTSYKKNATSPPTDMTELFCPTDNEHQLSSIAWENLEKIHTLTLYYLAQIYGAKGQALKSAIYCHNTLQRQLDGKDFDPIDWALNAATLSQFFMEKNGFKQARHHLAASSCILDKYEAELNQNLSRDESFDAKMEIFKHRSADVARCWIKYGLLLLAKSKERLLSHTDDDLDVNCKIHSDLEAISLEANPEISMDDLQHLEFVSLDLAKYECQITCNFVLTIQDARLVFLNLQTWFEKALSYYTLHNLASDHIEIIQDQSQMYLNLLFFDDSVDNQAKLHKRRVDLLENIINKVNAEYYLNYCRQIWFELAQTYSDILNIKCDRLKESTERPTPQALTKINRLVENSIHNFKCFIESFKKNNELPVKIPDDFEKAVLQAYFHIGALYNRFISLDKKQQLENINHSREFYKRVVDYCKVNVKARELIPMELSICDEMTNLLPMKIAKLQQEISE